MTVTSTDLDVSPLSPSLGAEVRGVDPRAELTTRDVQAVLDLLHRYKVLFFRGVNLDDQEHARFASWFGPPHECEFVVPVPGIPGLCELDTVSFFHADLQQMAEPPKYAMLRMDAVPPVGGDTMWADLVTSYEDLSPTMREFLERLDAEYSFLRYVGDGSNIAQERVDRNGGDFEKIRQEVQPREHPVVRHIPETGRNNYWVSRAFTRRILGLIPSESQALLEMLWGHQLLPQYVIRWRWAPGDLAFWDHRTTLHSGVRDFGDAKRVGRRATIGAERPVRAGSAA